VNTTPQAGSSLDARDANKTSAARFIDGFKDDYWDAARRVMAPGCILHHPLEGNIEAGPDGMVSMWAGFKQLSLSSWHPTPVMIAEGDFGLFGFRLSSLFSCQPQGRSTGQGEHAPPPTGGRLDHGMVNIVRLEPRKLAEIWDTHNTLGILPPRRPARWLWSDHPTSARRSRSSFAAISALPAE